MPHKPFCTKALITGATSGIGEALADYLESQGTHVLRFGSSDADLSTREGRKPILDAITEHSPDLIVNSAGIGYYGPALSHSIDEQLSVLEVNAAALVEITLHAGKTLIEKGLPGTILNISSIAAFLPYPTFALYSASKAFVNNFSMAVDTEWKPHNVRVFVSCPGPVNTNFRTRSSKGHPQQEAPSGMSIDTALYHILTQLSTKKPLVLFDWKTRLLLHLSRFFSRRYRDKKLIESIATRYPSQ